MLTKHRRALVMYGQMHFQRKNMIANYESDGLAATLVSRLEERTGTRVFTIWTTTNDLTALQPSVATWPVPYLAHVRGTPFGAADFSFYYPPDAPDALSGRFAIRDGKSIPIPRSEWRSFRAEDQFDAVLYRGPASPELEPSRERCRDTADIEELIRRWFIIAPQRAEELKRWCAADVPR